MRAPAPLIGQSYARQLAVGCNVQEGRVWEKAEEAETGGGTARPCISVPLSLQLPFSVADKGWRRVDPGGTFKQ